MNKKQRYIELILIFANTQKIMLFCTAQIVRLRLSVKREKDFLKYPI